ncbi:MAG: molybdopterin-synthase adenylyltransferase MoeB [Candidatus Kryptonium sp.]|nr:molybdopterin-synthase adenylyltransferase MoeB [Candidatus Kryptonium sp.]MDW8108042.1 molybdopterin-synthase adenylyltransferase MoeB [Candidatus Kryptonium sp.]
MFGQILNPRSMNLTDDVELTREEFLRYGRHLIMPEVGLDGQKRLKSSSVLIVGAGGLGSPLAFYLTAAGVGRIGIVDFDVVDLSNLQRQIIHTTKDVGRSKLESAKEKLEALNPNVEIETYNMRLTSENAFEIIENYDIIIDGTDNFPTRYLVNDACVILKKPNVYGSIFRFEGQASVFYSVMGPCYRCLYQEPPPPGLVPSCAEGGVLGVLPGIIGTIQALEAIKLILGVGEPLIGKLLLFDALKMKFRELKLRKNPQCPICGENPTIKELIDYEAFCGITPEQALREAGLEITPEELRSKLENGEDIILIDVREPHEYEINRIYGSKLIPLSKLPEKVNELDQTREIVLYCKMGGRSARAVQFLRELGFTRVKNLAGGIDAWIEKIEPNMPKY